MVMTNLKSDVKAKAAFVKHLQENGFQAAVVKEPADIVATKDGQTWYFEVKMTKRSKRYFGAATLTEWKQAVADPEHFRFVVAKTDETESSFEFIEYTPEQFMDFSCIPPFKFYFNINLDGAPCKSRTAVALTQENLQYVSECYETIRVQNRA